ncbi:MAG: hypothetical protein ABWY58_00130 [Aeromicrobium sp.]
MRSRSDRTVIAAVRKHHGLGNRVRVVLGTRSLARSTGRAFRYAWPVNDAFGARLDELWEIDDATIHPAVSRALTVRYPYRDESLSWLDDAKDDRIWQIRTAHALHLPAAATPWDEELRDLRPVAEIRDRVRAFHDQHLAGSAYVGVMIRAHHVSHDETLKESPLTWYLDRLRTIHEQRPDLRFFVSADTPEAQQAVHAAIPGCVSLTDKGAYNSLDGLTSAVVDLYLMASSAHLLGAHLSSFPELGQRLAGPALALETSRSDPRSVFDPHGDLTVAPDPTLPHLRTSVR